MIPMWAQAAAATLIVVFLGAAVTRRLWGPEPQHPLRKGSNHPASCCRPAPTPPAPPVRATPGVTLYAADGTPYNLPEVEKACSLYRYVIRQASALGWSPDDGEGVLEFLTRSHYAQGVEDARNTPLSAAALELADKWDRAKQVPRYVADDGVHSCADELRELVKP